MFLNTIKKTSKILLIFTFVSVYSWALSPSALEILQVARQDTTSLHDMKKLFSNVASLENISIKEVVSQLQSLDPNYATELVLDEDFFKLSYLIDNGWIVELLNGNLEELLVVALRQQHMPIILLVLKSGGSELVKAKGSDEILKQAGLEGSAWYKKVLDDWKNPETKINQEQASYEYRVDGTSRRVRNSLRDEAAMSPAGGAGRDEPKFATVPVPYATNRAMDDRYRSKINTIDGAASFYSYTNSGSISYGVANVTIPKIHQKGKLEDRGVFEFKHDPAKHVILKNLSLKTSEEFFAELGEMFKKREELFTESQQAKELFVYVHGFNVDFSYAMRKTAQMMHDMDYPGLSVAFSWPARAVSVPLPRDFREDVVRAENSIAMLELFLKQIIEKYPDRKIHVIAHSLGTRVLSNVIMNLAKTLSPARAGEAAKKLFGEVILAAPAIDAQTFVNNWASQITPHCDRISIYASDDDYALKVQHLAEGPNFSFPLGLWDKGANRRAISDGITHYDLSNLSAGTFSLDHSVYSEVPVALDHMKLILNHRPTDMDLAAVGYISKTNALDFFSRKAKDLWEFLDF